MKCILHIGVHKTGSTTIQRGLDGFDDGECFYADMGKPNHSLAFQTLFRKDNLANAWTSRGVDPKERLSYFEKCLETTLSQDRNTVIFSAENITLLDDVETQAMRRRLMEVCTSISVVMFVRDPLAWATSYAQERVKHGKANPFSEPAYSFESQYKKLLSAFDADEIVVRKFEDCFEFDGDIVEFFLETAGLKKLDRPVAIDNVNESLSLEAVSVLLKFNKMGFSIRNGTIMNAAHWRFVRGVGEIFRDGQKIKPGSLPIKYIYSDYRFLKDVCGILYNESSTINISSIGFDYDYLVPVLVERINSFLKAKRFQQGSSESPEVAIASLYAFFVAQELAIHGVVLHSYKYWWEYTKYKSFLLLSRLPFISEKFRLRCFKAAERRKRFG